MKSLSDITAPVELTNTSEMPSWDRPRTSDELLSFITRREAIITSSGTDLEDF